MFLFFFPPLALECQVWFQEEKLQRQQNHNATGRLEECKCPRVSVCAEGRKEVVYKTGKKRENEMEKRSDDSLQLLETTFPSAFYRPMSLC